MVEPGDGAPGHGPSAQVGQDKPVFVHGLIAENTVEAAIQRMQARKQGLADALFEGTGRGPLGLTDEDIDALFGLAQL